MQEVRSLIQHGVVLFHKLSPDALRTWLHHHRSNTNKNYGSPAISLLFSNTNNWSKYLDIRPHRCCTQMVQSHSPGCAHCALLSNNPNWHLHHTHAELRWVYRPPYGDVATVVSLAPIINVPTPLNSDTPRHDMGQCLKTACHVWGS